MELLLGNFPVLYKINAKRGPLYKYIEDIVNCIISLTVCLLLIVYIQFV